MVFVGGKFDTSQLSGARPAAEIAPVQAQVGAEQRRAEEECWREIELLLSSGLVNFGLKVNQVGFPHRKNSHFFRRRSKPHSEEA